MYLRIAAYCLAWSVFCSGVGHCAAEIPTSMAGNAACVSFLKARSERKTLPFELWLSGYLTGLATYDRRINNVPKLEDANGETGTLLLESYCKVHPQERFQTAAREMARTLFYPPGRQ